MYFAQNLCHGGKNKNLIAEIIKIQYIEDVQDFEVNRGNQDVI